MSNVGQQFSLEHTLESDSLQGLPLLAGFTGKPFTFGGPEEPDNTVQVIETHRSALREALVEKAHLLEAEQKKVLQEKVSNGASLIVMNQVHGKRVAFASEGVFAETDAVILDKALVPAIVLVADCVPILLYDPVTHIAALVHAGWRGTAQRVVVETIETMQARCNVNASDIKAVIGPSIGRSSYDVTKHVVDDLADSLSLSSEDFLAARFGEEDTDDFLKFWVDLKAVNAEQMKQLGVLQIETVPICTVTMNHKFHSHRKGDTGRNCGYMMLLANN